MKYLMQTTFRTRPAEAVKVIWLAVALIACSASAWAQVSQRPQVAAPPPAPAARPPGPIAVVLDAGAGRLLQLPAPAVPGLASDQRTPTGQPPSPTSRFAMV